MVVTEKVDQWIARITAYAIIISVSIVVWEAPLTGFVGLVGILFFSAMTDRCRKLFQRGKKAPNTDWER